MLFLAKTAKTGPPDGGPNFYLAAAAVVIAATTIVLIGVAAAQTVIATAAEQDQQDDDPAHIPTAETIVTHNKYLHDLLATWSPHSKVFRFAFFVKIKRGPQTPLF